MGKSRVVACHVATQSRIGSALHHDGQKHVVLSMLVISLGLVCQVGEVGRQLLCSSMLTNEIHDLLAMKEGVLKPNNESWKVHVQMRFAPIIPTTCQ
jgi:hypothetical protein